MHATYVLGLVALGVAGAAIRVLVVFRASREEAQRAMPGDALVPDLLYVTTQALTIEAPPTRVWPWLAQMGAGRAGWYSYDRIDNGGHPSSEVLVPEYQQVAAGDVFPAIPGSRSAFVVAEAAEPCSLVLTVPGANGSTIVTWAFLLVGGDDGSTRLIVRGRVAASWCRMAAGSADHADRIFIERVYDLLGRLPAPLLLAIGGFGHRVMQNHQLRGIRRRAEAENFTEGFRPPLSSNLPAAAVRSGS